MNPIDPHGKTPDGRIRGSADSTGLPPSAGGEGAGSSTASSRGAAPPSADADNPDPVTPEEVDRAATRARAVLDNNWRSGTRKGRDFAYTRPSPIRYPWQWYWDSCFCAMARRREDPGRAQAELDSLLGAQREDGFIGHTIFWDSAVHWHRLPFYNVLGRWSLHTETIQPPMLAWAWRVCGRDPAAEPRLALHHAWIREHRHLEGDDLVWIVQPDESGLDASPKFDPIWTWRAHARLGFPLLVHRNRRLGFDARRIRDAGGPVVCEVLTNVLWSLSCQALGEPSVTPALVDRLWDPELGLFFDEVAPSGDRPRIVTWASLSPLALPDLPEEIGRRMVEEHLIPHFLTPVPIPSVPPDMPGYAEGIGRWIRAYWRGPAWANSAWLIWLGLIRLGYKREADRVRDGWVRVVAREGLREFYDPLTGEGHGARKFGWTCLILDMLAGDEEGASRSYLSRTPGEGEPASTDAGHRSASRREPEGTTDRDAPSAGM